MKKFFGLALALCTIITIGIALLASTASASDPCSAGYVLDDGVCKAIDDIKNPSTGGLFSLVASIIRYILYAVGILAVIMIIVGGMRYATSAGEAEKVKKAKSTLLYSIIGLVLALLAATIIQVVTYLSNPSRW